MAAKAKDPSAVQSQTTAGTKTDPGSTSSTAQDAGILAREAGLENAARNTDVGSMQNDNLIDGTRRLGPSEPTYQDR